MMNKDFRNGRTEFPGREIRVIRGKKRFEDTA